MVTIRWDQYHEQGRIRDNGHTQTGWDMPENNKIALLMCKAAISGYQHCKLHKHAVTKEQGGSWRRKKVSSRIEQLPKPGASSAWESTKAPWAVEIGPMALWKVQVKVSAGDQSVRHQTTQTSLGHHGDQLSSACHCHIYGRELCSSAMQTDT